MKILIYGYGNPGRQDDALGVKLAENIEQWIIEENIKGVETDCNYQLNIEDADRISQSDFVIFADASTEQIDGFIFTEVNPDTSSVEFTMHAVSPAFVLDLCRKLYKKTPETYLLHIKGFEWGFEEKLSEGAMINLSKTTDFVKRKIMSLLCL